MSMNESNAVSLVYQSDRMSCWAAAAVMMLGWRDQVCYADDQEVRARYGDMGGDGTNPDEDLQWRTCSWHLARAWRSIPPLADSRRAGQTCCVGDR